MIYSLIRNFLFSLDPEAAHQFAMKSMKMLHRGGLGGCLSASVPNTPVSVMGITFPNPVGLAAGLDKNAEYIDALAAMGFGFIEVGTVTPRPQPGNPKPRMFRIPEKQAIINRMGFNNLGVEALLRNVHAPRFFKAGGILGINIGKNFDTPIENAADDYLRCLEQVYTSASYVAINISSPNTKNLRDLQRDDALDSLLATLKTSQMNLADKHGRYVPMALKIAPDLDDTQIQSIAELLKHHKIDAVIATNTTLDRDSITGCPHADEAGGLSGKPVFERSTAVQQKLATALSGEVPIIGVGGIMDKNSASAKFAAGAKLVQLYTGFIYEGPDLIREAALAYSTNAKR